MSGRPRCVTCSQRCPRGHRRTTLPPATGNSSAIFHENSSLATPKKSNSHSRGWSNWGPLCGSNERTYESWCHMLKDACATGFVISTKHRGPCESDGRCCRHYK
ncbi:hypothetical protein J437_LFUL003680 [Ladona fulva]|uniref:Kazal-like domain-containing protein n=1 Tax=Ladona fulva TaxID=123851 RepID=A0A8K0JWY4_LADFU|nr:hypothetical protein J437_LFUL003680 [Ladona fulva]